MALNPSQYKPDGTPTNIGSYYTPKAASPATPSASASVAPQVVDYSRANPETARALAVGTAMRGSPVGGVTLKDGKYQSTGGTFMTPQGSYGNADAGVFIPKDMNTGAIKNGEYYAKPQGQAMPSAVPSVQGTPAPSAVPAIPSVAPMTVPQNFVSTVSQDVHDKYHLADGTNDTNAINLAHKQALSYATLNGFTVDENGNAVKIEQPTQALSAVDKNLPSEAQSQILVYQKQWAEAHKNNDLAGMSMAHENADKVRAQYGDTSNMSGLHYNDITPAVTKSAQTIDSILAQGSQLTQEAAQYGTEALAALSSQWQSMSTMLDTMQQNITEQVQQQFGQDDPSLTGAINMIRDEADRQTAIIMEEMSARGMGQSGIMLDEANKIGRDTSNQIAKLQGDQMAKMQEQMFQAVMTISQARISALANNQKSAMDIMATKADMSQKAQSAIMNAKMQAAQIMSSEEQNALNRQLEVWKTNVNWSLEQSKMTLDKQLKEYELDTTAFQKALDRISSENLAKIQEAGANARIDKQITSNEKIATIQAQANSSSNSGDISITDEMTIGSNMVNKWLAQKDESTGKPLTYEQVKNLILGTPFSDKGKTYLVALLDNSGRKPTGNLTLSVDPVISSAVSQMGTPGTLQLQPPTLTPFPNVGRQTVSGSFFQ